jgi:hypothetical protein
MGRAVAAPAVVEDAVTDLSNLPLILTLPEIARIYRLSESTIRRALQKGIFRPRPWDHYPYRWTREAVADDLKRRREGHTPRPHGFASKRRRQAKATLEARPKRTAG